MQQSKIDGSGDVFSVRIGIGFDMSSYASHKGGLVPYGRRDPVRLRVYNNIKLFSIPQDLFFEYIF